MAARKLQTSNTFNSMIHNYNLLPDIIVIEKDSEYILFSTYYMLGKSHIFANNKHIFSHTYGGL